MTKSDLIAYCDRTSFFPDSIAICRDTKRAEFLFPYSEMAVNFSAKRTIEYLGCTMKLHTVVKKTPLGEAWADRTAEDTPSSEALNNRMENTVHDTDYERKVFVSASSAISVDRLKMFLPNRKRSGGGPIKNIEETAGDNNFLVVFENKEDAENLLKRGNGSLDGVDISFSLPKENRSIRNSTKDVKVPANILVTGISGHLSDEVIELFFEKESKSVQEEFGDVLEVKQTIYGHIVRFGDEKDARRVAGRTVDIEGNMVVPELVRDIRQKDICAIRIDNISPDISDKILKLIFESKSASGGGEIEDMFVDRDNMTAVITYVHLADVNGVIQCHSQRGLEYEASKFGVARLDLGSPVRIHHGERDTRKILVDNLSQQCTRKDLETYIKRHSRNEVASVTYSFEPGKAIVEMENALDDAKLNALQRACSERPIKNTLVAITAVKSTTKIQVNHIGDHKESYIQQYFEDKVKHLSVKITSVQLIRPSAIIEFDNIQAPVNLASSQHEMDKDKLEIRLYYDKIGIIPPNFDSSQPRLDIPKDIVVNIAEEFILKFWLKREKHRTIVTQRIQNEYGNVIWEEILTHSIKICCTLTPETDDYISRARKWNETIRNKFNEILQEYSELSVRPLQEAVHDFVEQIQIMQIQNTDNVILNIEENTGVVTVFGVNLESQNLHKVIGDIYQNVIDNMSKRNTIITEQMNALSPVQLKLIEKANLVASLDKTYEGLKIDMRYGNLRLEGLPATISAAKIEIKTFVTEVNKEHYILSSVLKTLVGSDKVQDYLSNHIDKHIKGTVMLEFTPSDIVIHGHRVDTFQTIVEELQSLLVEETRQCDSEEISLLHSDVWKKEITSLSDNFGEFLKADVVLMDTGGIFTVAATGDVIKEVRKQINDFLADNLESERFIKMEIGKLKCLEKHFKTEVLDGIIKIGINIKLTPCFDKQKPGYNLVGTKENVRQFVKLLETVSDRIHMHERMIQKMSIGKILTEEKGKTRLEGIESRYRVFIEIKSTNYKTRFGDSNINTCYKKIVGNTSIVIKQDNILKIQADVLVNAANVNLSHRGGVAKSISDTGGPIIKEECDNHVQQNGKLHKGDIFVSSPGRLPFKKIIHAVGPRWHGGEKNEEALLRRAINNVLQEVCSQAFVSVALPCISAGIFKYPVRKAAEVIVGTVVAFCKKSNLLKCIYLVDQSPQTATAFWNTLEQQLSSDMGVEQLSSVQKSDQWEVVEEFEVEGLDEVSTSLGSMESGISSEISKFITREGIEVQILQGNIESTNGDVIVNSTTTNFAIGGAIAGALYRAGGKIYQDENRNCAARGGMKHGDLVVTSGGDLPCRSVYHGAMEKWDGSGNVADKVLRTFLSACLEKGDTSRICQVVFPPLGTGALLTPVPEFTNLFLDEVLKFSVTHPNSSLKKIKIVMPTDHYQKMQEMMAVLGKRLQMALPAGNGTIEDSHIPPGDVAAQCGKIHVHIKNADISKEQADAIVNITGAGFNKGGGQVERSIWESAGGEFMDEYKNKKRQQNGDMLVTSSGSLPCGNIIHYAHTGSPDYVDVTCRLLMKADEMNLTSISLPALGTGAYGRNPKLVVEDMWNGICKFNAERKNIGLRDVIIAICAVKNNVTYDEFRRYILTKSNNVITSVSSLVGSTSVSYGPLKLTIKQGDITTEQTDAIFCFTQGQASRSIIAQGGQALADEVQNNNGRSFIVTSAENLPCQKVVHCSASDSIEYDVCGALLAIENLQLRSMTFPALQTGDGRVKGDGPPNRMLDGVERFLNERSSQHVTHVNIVILHVHQETFRVFRDVIIGKSDMNKDVIMEDDSTKMVFNNCEKKVEEITLLIYSNSAESVKSAMDDVEKMWEDRISTLYIRDETSLKELNFETITRIKQFQSLHSVDIAQTENEIKIEGLSEDTQEVKDKIVEMLNHNMEQKRALSLFALIRWQYQSGQMEYNDVSIEINYKLEAAYENKEHQVEWRDTMGTHTMNLNLEDGTGTGDTGNIKRTICKRIPEEWRNTDKKLCDVASGSEYDNVRDMFQRTGNFHIKKIQRVQNISLWLRYVVHKEDMDNGTRNQPLERDLWHGTSEDTVEKIINKCFDRNYGGKNATRYGKGAYFARDASYSAGFSEAGNSGDRCMFLCSVLTGDYTLGNSNLRDCPSKDEPGDPALCYDSVVDDMNDPSMFVVFNDAQAYPKYLIRF